ncbi:DUF397 domain-containing protein [Streptomyces subrutilus]|uniref:DUF397 domain-containing protein n=1 Tax=Streptomyces subrutilus TaxID=36818 RepID=A0A1E5PQI4_9ACTN|nr:DUF397 domain-containing protein [Streptomyces subrutilus]OEJ31818.1 DUF397 domain-containing protein [Streptomyces subrutilus]
METIQHLTGARWRKSSYSGDTGGDCVECAPFGAAAWQKSSYSGGAGGDCVGVSAQPGLVAVRDSKTPAGPVFTVGAAAFQAFVGALSA